MKVSMRFEGGTELAAGLNRLSTRVSKGLLQKALMAGAEPIRKQGSVNAPHDPSTPQDIKDNIVAGPVRKVPEDATAGVAVGPRRGFAYGLPNEIGTVNQPARPFMRPAFDTEKERALGAVNLVLRKELIRRDVLGSARTVGQGTNETFADDDDGPVSGGPGGGLL
jgi:HK97 gp10 family phage protein